MSERANQDVTTVRRSPRRIAIGAVCVTVVATITAPGAFVWAIPLILGLIADTFAARRSQWLMWAGAAYLSLTALFMEAAILPEFVAELRVHHRLGGVGPVLLPFWIASILLIVWCDVAFIIDAVRAVSRRVPAERRARGVGDWIVWITALSFTIYSFWVMRFFFGAYTHGLVSPGIALPTLAPVVIATILDIALIIDATRMRLTSCA
jgi:hypothetical protein